MAFQPDNRGQAVFDKIMVNQGATLDSWAPHSNDQNLWVLAEGILTLEDALAAVGRIFQIMGYGPNAVQIVNPERARIDLITSNLEDGPQGDYTHYQQTTDQIALIATSLYLNGTPDGDLDNSQIHLNTAQLAIEAARISAVVAEVDHSETGIEAAHARMDLIAGHITLEVAYSNGLITSLSVLDLSAGPTGSSALLMADQVEVQTSSLRIGEFTEIGGDYPGIHINQVNTTLQIGSENKGTQTLKAPLYLR